MEKYFIDEDWKPITINIPRPQGFNVTEEISYKPANEWKGNSNGKYAVYLLRKQGIDHFTVINKLSRILNGKVYYIGIKDANAITEQLIYTESKNIVEYYESENFSIKFLGYTNSKFNHTGNIFQIEICSDNQKEMEYRVKRLSEIGYLPAYIGYQRFGTRRPITHIIGKMLVLRKWKDAIDFLIGYPFEGESEIVKKARSEYMKGNYKSALELFPKKFKDERIALKLLIENKDYFTILRNLQTPLSFFVEAYQSYLFNRYLSKIINYPNIEQKYIEIPNSYDKCDNICKEIFREEGIINSSLKIPELKVNIGSLTRQAYMKVRRLNFENKKISFALDRGMYATIVIREISRTDPRLFT